MSSHCEGSEPGYCYTIEHGGYRKENIDIEYCEQVAAMGKDSDIIKFKQIPQAAEYDYLSATLLIRGWHLESGRSGEMADYHSGPGR